jgi:hypothetical protein
MEINNYGDRNNNLNYSSTSNNNNGNNNNNNHYNNDDNNNSDIDYDNYNMNNKKADNVTGINNQHMYNNVNQPEFNENFNGNINKSTYVNTDPPDPVPTDISSAIHTILQWTTSNVSRMSQLRWTVMGRERNVDGSVNESSHPIYAMTNPNDLINTVLQVKINMHGLVLRILTEELRS